MLVRTFDYIEWEVRVVNGGLTLLDVAGEGEVYGGLVEKGGCDLSFEVD